ncbi:MAG: hypothetical protein AAF609_22350 [Cyanobacteria bacterium P01_C01_bin.120]
MRPLQTDWRKELKWLNPGFSKASTKLKTIYVLRAIARTQGIRAVVANVETYDAGTGRSSDLYGFLDILVDHNRGIQACGKDWQPHISKFRDECPDAVKWWLSEESRTLELWGWRQVVATKSDGSKAKRKLWIPRIQLITPGFLWGDEEPTMIEFEDVLKDFRVEPRPVFDRAG